MSSSEAAGVISAAANVSALPSSVPSLNVSSAPRDLISLPLRGLQRAESFAFSFIPRRLARIVGLGDMSTHLWGATGAGMEGGVAAATTEAAGEAVREAVVEAAAQPDAGFQLTDLLQSAIKFSGFFSYLTSRWSIACFTVALVLNRIAIYASTRRHLQLDWTRRLALRIIPILLFISQIHSLLRAIRCQTSPAYPELRYGSPGKRLSFDHAGHGGFLYSTSSALLSWETDQQSCSAMNMSRVGTEIPYGTFKLLWPVFLRLCLGHFVETLSSSLQGRPVVTEGGMSIFEHSLSFAEAESTISQYLGLGPFGSPKPSVSRDSDGDTQQSPLNLLTKSQILDRMNVTPELLLIALISCCHCLSSNLLDVIGKQSRYRLFNTAFWGLCFMAAMTWGLAGGSTLGTDDLSLKFPTVCVVGFVPHLLILCGIIVCANIYALALFITAFSLPSDTDQQLTPRERFRLAHENMQGSNQVSSVRVNRHEDFYSALLRIGYTALTAASEAVFLNEGRGVVARNMTWLEEDRLTELEKTRRGRLSRHSVGVTNSDFHFESGEPNLFEIQEAPSEWESGYGREKKIEKPKSKSRTSRYQSNPGGVGAFRGLFRCYQGLTFFRAIFYIMFKWLAFASDRALTSIGINARPRWFKGFVRKKETQEASGKMMAESLDFWMLTDEGELELPENNEFDVEKEMRKRERLQIGNWNPTDEQRLDEKLYNWWKAGGSWGNQDQTPDYDVLEDDWDDTTSVVSTATTIDSEWEDESDGRRTPTQTDPFPGQYSRDGTPAPESLMDIGSIARLLDPRDEETRQEARILAAHLNAGREGRILTRRQYQDQLERQRAQVLLSSPRSRIPQPNSSQGTSKPTTQQESEILENLILIKRSAAVSSNSPSSVEQTWESGASGLGASGPPCVVCQTNSRSIIVWPCRCLCICEDCRVSLAMNNFGSCVTCRQEVGGFVRLWVP
ncbi:putative ubiquitin-protein ligase (Asi3) [Aspergillus stella-maris]|uniref:putative ubiquitin-protein ligase (Asi3) n=1 Tax=Aspergillus stella-maris TaxID=1810926 RepID=UPI003CCD5CC2